MHMMKTGISRRGLLVTTGASVIALSIVPGGMIIGAGEAWSQTAKALKPETFAALIQMGRDIYPHDSLGDEFYAKAIKVHDDAAAKDEAAKAMFEDGVAALDQAAMKAEGVIYRLINWEDDRVALLKEIETGGFFQKVRGDLVSGLYNNHDVWNRFGYEGESYSKGGYLERGFDDIDWL